MSERLVPRVNLGENNYESLEGRNPKIKGRQPRPNNSSEMVVKMLEYILGLWYLLVAIVITNQIGGVFLALCPSDAPRAGLQCFPNLVCFYNLVCQDWNESLLWLTGYTFVTAAMPGFTLLVVHMFSEEFTLWMHRRYLLSLIFIRDRRYVQCCRNRQVCEIYADTFDWFAPHVTAQTITDEDLASVMNGDHPEFKTSYLKWRTREETLRRAAIEKVARYRGPHPFDEGTSLVWFVMYTLRMRACHIQQVSDIKAIEDELWGNRLCLNPAYGPSKQTKWNFSK